MKTLTLLYDAIRNKLFSRTRKAASENMQENLKDNQDAVSANSAFPLNTDQSNRGDETQRFSVNTAKTGDKKNNGD